jgi:hypothetical protein
MLHKPLNDSVKRGGLFVIALLIALAACRPVPVATENNLEAAWLPTLTPGLTAEPTLPASPSPGVPSGIDLPGSQTPDRLAEPPLPANPTQYELGRHLYWMNCMPCHGDRGQGLTDEFRSLWDPEHQNCWGRGCHAGRERDEGYPLPHSIPAVISSTGELPPFATAAELFAYLRTTHPPQHPGYLPEVDYWALTAYLLIENNRLAPGQELGPE